MSKRLQSMFGRKGKSEEDPFDVSLDLHDPDEEESEDLANILSMSVVKELLDQPDGADDDDKDTPLASPIESLDGVSSKKQVTFTDLETSSHPDEEKTHDELIDKVGKLQARLNQAEIDKSAEKAMRRKKEKSLVKLAKELNKRATDQKEKENTINTCKGVIADLEAKLNATRTEMDERIASNEKKTKEYNNNLDAAHTKYRQAVAEHDAKIAELSKTHAQEIEKLQRSVKDTEIECERLRTLVAQTKEQFSDTAKDRAQVIEGYKKELADAEKRFKQAALDHDKVIADISKKHLELVDDLRRQLLAANLECDKIRTELASQQMRAAPQEASEIISRTMKSVGGAPKTSERLRQSSPLVSTLRAFGVVLLLHLFAFQQLGFLSLNAMCAPVMPGTVVHEASSFDAPWWVPQSHKETVFGVICGTRPRTQLTWTHKGRLVVTDMEHKEKLLEKKADHVVVQATSVNFYAKNGKIEQSQAPWSK